MLRVPELLTMAIDRDEERIDRAEAILDGMLDGENAGDRKDAAFFVLRQSKRAAERGWRMPDVEVNVNVPTRVQMTRYTWANGEVIAEIPELVPINSRPMIEHDPDERARIEDERRRIAAEAEEERRRQGDQDSG
jgi:hypothetical protein